MIIKYTKQNKHSSGTQRLDDLRMMFTVHMTRVRPDMAENDDVVGYQNESGGGTMP